MTEHEKDVYCEKCNLQRSKATPPGEQFMQTLSLRVDVNFQTPVEVCRRHMTWIIFRMSYIVWEWKSAHQNLANSPCKVGLKLINAESTTILQAGQMIRCFWSSCKKKKSGFRLRKKTLKLSVHECLKLKPMTPTLAYRPRARGLLLPKVPRVAAFRSPGMGVER